MTDITETMYTTNLALFCSSPNTISAHHSWATAHCSLVKEALHAWSACLATCNHHLVKFALNSHVPLKNEGMGLMNASSVLWVPSTTHPLYAEKTTLYPGKPRTVLSVVEENIQTGQYAQSMNVLSVPLEPVRTILEPEVVQLAALEPSNPFEDKQRVMFVKPVDTVVI